VKVFPHQIYAAVNGAKRCYSSAPAEKDDAWFNDERMPVTFEDVSKAMYLIRSGIVRTTTKRSHYLSEMCGMDLFIKNEFTQFTGSFKERGARNALLSLNDEERAKGVMAASAGNHALALARHGGLLGIPVTCFMPTIAPLTKVQKCGKLGANIVIHGAHIGEAKIEAETNPAYEGLKYINGYDDPEIIAGAGTMGIEILEQVPEVDVLVIPVGGAGLIAGVALAAKTLKPNIKVIGVEPVNCASYSSALAAGRPTAPGDASSTLADGLAVPVVGPHAFKVARRYVDEVIQVNEKAIALAVLRLVENERYVVEGGGATGLAALLPGQPLHNHPDLKGKKVVVPLCGGNIDSTTLGRVIDRGMAADGRLVRFIATVSDRPGGIAKLTTHLAEAKASIKDIYHERAWLHTSTDQVQVKCVIEVSGSDHGEAVHQMLLARGYDVHWGRDSHLSW